MDWEPGSKQKNISVTMPKLMKAAMGVGPEGEKRSQAYEVRNDLKRETFPNHGEINDLKRGVRDDLKREKFPSNKKEMARGPTRGSQVPQPLIFE